MLFKKCFGFLMLRNLLFMFSPPHPISFSAAWRFLLKAIHVQVFKTKKLRRKFVEILNRHGAQKQWRKKKKRCEHLSELERSLIELRANKKENFLVDFGYFHSSFIVRVFSSPFVGDTTTRSSCDWMDEDKKIESTSLHRKNFSCRCHSFRLLNTIFPSLRQIVTASHLSLSAIRRRLREACCDWVLKLFCGKIMLQTLNEGDENEEAENNLLKIHRSTDGKVYDFFSRLIWGEILLIT